MRIGSDQLTKGLGIGNIDDLEVAALCASKFGHQQASLEERSVDFFDKGAREHALRLIYSKKGRLLAAEAGPALTKEDLVGLEAIARDHFRSDGPIKIGRCYLFASQPIEGYWQLNDVRLLPVPPGSPLPSYAAAEHPSILEFEFRESPVERVSWTRRFRRGWELSLFFGSMLEGAVYAWEPGHHPSYWVLHPRSSDSEERITELAQRWYEVPGFRRVDDEHYTLERIDPMEEESPDAYYRHSQALRTQPLRVPSTLRASLESFLGLEPEQQERFLRAAYWFRHAAIAGRSSRSAALAALVQSVEALVLESKEDHCPTCGKAAKGAVAQFDEFLKSVAPGMRLQAGRRALYAARSKILHGDKLLMSDLHFGGHDLSPRTTDEWAYQDDAYLAARVALVNTLVPGTISGSDRENGDS